MQDAAGNSVHRVRSSSLGDCRLEALCFDGSRRLAHIRGKFCRKGWIKKDDIILLSLRDYQDEKGEY
jgi:translation initiation factor 1A